MTTIECRSGVQSEGFKNVEENQPLTGSASETGPIYLWSLIVGYRRVLGRCKRGKMIIIVALSWMGVRERALKTCVTITYDRTQNHLGTCSTECERDIITRAC